MNSLPLGAGFALDWGFAGEALERESGDLHVVAAFTGGVMIAVMDGLGHGPLAAQAARRAGDVVLTHAGEPVDTLLGLCHQELQSTRGVAMTAVSFRSADASLSWGGIGNVAALLFRADPALRAREAVVSRGGVIGHQIPTPRASSLRIAPGDVLILATDGIRSGFEASVDIRSDPTLGARVVLDAYARHSDDALVVFARFSSA